jgi:hypothetical protein
MKKLLLLLACLLGSFSVFSQITFQKVYPGCYGYSVVQTFDGGYAIVGNLCYGYNGIYFIKTNPFGDTVMTRTYGGSDICYGISIAQTSDSGYIMAGTTFTNNSSNACVYLLKTKANGDTIWTKSYCGNNFSYGYSVLQTNDGGYIVAGSSAADSSNVYVIKTNFTGDTLWTRMYGGIQFDEGACIKQTISGGYIITGSTKSFGAGMSDVYLISINSTGNILWTKTYGGVDNDYGKSVAQTQDSGFVIAGITHRYAGANSCVYLIRTNNNGDTLWTKSILGIFPHTVAFSTAQTVEGGYIIAGYAHGLYDDAYLVKTDANGDTLWTRTYNTGRSEIAYSVAQTSDNGYILAGSSEIQGTPSINIFLFKTDSNGITSGNLGICNDLNRKHDRISIFPNPATTTLNITGLTIAVTAEVYDISGKQLLSKRLTTQAIDISRLAPGLYFIKLTTAEGSVVKKFVKE